MVGLLGIEDGFALTAQKLIELTDAALVQADDLAIDAARDGELAGEAAVGRRRSTRRAGDRGPR